MKKKTMWIKKVLFKGFVLAMIGVISLLSINGYVKSYSAGKILTIDEAKELEGIDCILVLGCGVRADGVPSDMLADRLDRSIELYKKNVSGKLLMSGDHGRKDYDEVNVMKQYAINSSVPSQDVFMDHAGFSTYESLYRARDIFEADRIIIVTQSYHMHRALYIAEKMGLEAYGVTSDQRKYLGQEYREMREMLARTKDFFAVIISPKPTYLGEAIPVSGDGDSTND